MKRCPECGRDYNDDSLSFCLDDGAALVQGSMRTLAAGKDWIFRAYGVGNAIMITDLR